MELAEQAFSARLNSALFTGILDKGHNTELKKAKFSATKNNVIYSKRPPRSSENF